MKNPVITINIIILTFSLSSNFIFAWEPYDRIIATVNSKPIVESEVINKLNQLDKIKKIKKNRITFQKSRIIDKFIENALIDETAENESILVNDKKIYIHIQKLMNDYFIDKFKSKEDLTEFTDKLIDRLKDKMDDKKSRKNDALYNGLDKFLNFVEKKQKTNFVSYFDEIRIQMKKEQVIRVAIGISPPSNNEALDWYNKNKNKLGFEVLTKHILLKPKNRSRAEERKTNKFMISIRNRVMAGESFEKLARKYSQDPGSAKKGGDIGWMMLAQLDPLYAGNVYRMTRRGQISRVFKSSFGYHIVKYLGRRAVDYKNVRNMIMYRLYSEKLTKQFQKWVLRKKRQSDILIFMKDYVKNNG